MNALSDLFVRDVAAAMEELAPTGWAAEWDNVGLLVGGPETPVRRCLVVLDCDVRAVAEARRRQAQLVLSHHPVIFKPLRRLDPEHPATRAAQAGIAVYCAHTNLDVTLVSDVLARRLGVEDAGVLEATARERLHKLVTFVPESHAEGVAAALAQAGAGRMGDYDACSFRTPGTGTFRPLPGAEPFVGAVGELARVDEVRLEVLVPEAAVDDVLAALAASHPYEEVAYDLIALANEGPSRGFGRVGALAEPVPLAAFARRVGEALACSQVLRWAGDPDRPVRRVAVCGGSGADMIGAGVAAGADVLVTGDVRYHQAQAAEAAGLGIVDAGHFATEFPAVPALAGWLRGRFAGLDVVAADWARDVWRGVAP